ncbi:ClpP/crotonase-like domain-containing protein [Clohesyomyces aquaticus]|uniref:ClpP/crotonase-like domain-containing protein n=1 Tax=Clohesyomyces aquaticus TaxID=1231657 RepID=A0A1Y1YCD8_9PLEO|nr:ClpP/crotonase-like domain-containing protein [Clohesyomyces aquaticus]
MKFEHLSLERRGDVFIITLQRPPENRLCVDSCRQISQAFHCIQDTLGPDSPGAVITKGSDSKPFANSDGFYPMLHTILDFPFPTIALTTGHPFGGACPFALAHDHRIMNSERGFLCMPPVDLGLHFDGMGSLLRLKLSPPIVRKMLFEGHRWTGKEAPKDGVVDFIAHPDKMLEAALELGQRLSPKAKAGVYGVLRSEL